MHPAALPDDVLRANCDVQRTRRSGPGGQHRNKTESAIVLVHRPTGVRAEASERRSQYENMSRALFRLRVTLACNHREPVAADQTPSVLWLSRVNGGAIRVNSAHDDFPALLAEALDAVTHYRGDFKPAAERWHCTPSQLWKFIQNEPQAISIVNALRQANGLKPLR